MSMVRYTPDELRTLTVGYIHRQADVERECRAAVATWRFADKSMVDLQPLSDQVDRFFEYMRGWDVAAKGRWLSGEHEVEYAFAHGYDAQGRIRVLTCGESMWFFCYSPRYIDEMKFLGSDAAIVKRLLLRAENGQPDSLYEMRVLGSRVECIEEVFEWLERQLTKSIVRTWTWEDNLPVESEFSETYRYSYDRQGLLVRCVRTDTRCGRAWGRKAVFSRYPMRRLIDRAIHFLRRWTIEEYRRRTWRGDKFIG